ncbi:MAG: UDP-N-acetylenolpyruvoylglucosamine reductase, partial [Proteobacteria bacterium]|nr:UDP-N-acetylenolpyruvoylglucosamine reductase [Pseudomonadota bacterium]
MTIKLDKLIQNLRGELVRAEPLARLTWLRVGG